jgi:hypothetical protein
MSNDGHGTWTRMAGDTRYWTTVTPHLRFFVWSHWWKSSKSYAVGNILKSANLPESVSDFPHH